MAHPSTKSPSPSDCRKNPRGRPRDPALHDRRTDEILRKAVEVFARHGYPNTDVQFIADPLGISKGTVYRYFESKERLFLAAVTWGVERLEEHMERVTNYVEDAVEKMVVAVRAYLEFFRSNPDLAELFIQERAEFRGTKKPVYFEQNDTKRCDWRERIEGMIAAGRVRAVPVERVMDVIGDLLYGTMLRNHMMGREKPYEQQAQDILDVVFNGILTEEEKARRARLISAANSNGNKNGHANGQNGKPKHVNGQNPAAGGPSGGSPIGGRRRPRS
jgi:AcrR family transcriptional regulator